MEEKPRPTNQLMEKAAKLLGERGYNTTLTVIAKPYGSHEVINVERKDGANAQVYTAPLLALYKNAEDIARAVNNIAAQAFRKEVGGLAMTRQHDCPFCGQMQMLIIGAEIEDEHQLNHLAAMACNCDEAQAYKNKADMTTYAEAAIKDFFEDDSESVREWLISCLPKLADWTVEKISVTLKDGVKATLKRKEGSISVQRVKTLKKEKG